MVVPFNHKSLQAEHRIKSLSTILTKHLTEQGRMAKIFTISHFSS